MGGGRRWEGGRDEGEWKGKARGGACLRTDRGLQDTAPVFSAAHMLRSKFLWCVVWRRLEVQFPACGPLRCDCRIRGPVRHELPAAVCVVKFQNVRQCSTNTTTRQECAAGRVELRAKSRYDPRKKRLALSNENGVLLSKCVQVRSQTAHLLHGHMV